jgi:putative ABC transport system substrate-binding protein
MKGKKFLSLPSAAILVFFSFADAQQPAKIPRVGFIYSSRTPVDASPQFDAFTLRLRDLGYGEGKNILIERRHAEGRLDRIPALVNDLVQQQVDVIVATNNVAIQAAKKATKTIPIVIMSTVDPVVAGYVKSFAEPGGNITGTTNFSRKLSGKRVEFLKEILPKVSRVAILWDADGPGPKVAFNEYKTAAQVFKLEIGSFPVRGPTPDFTGAIRGVKKARADALIVVANPLIDQDRKELFELLTKNRLPSMTEERKYAEAGGLVSYGASSAEMYRLAAEYVNRILKGAKPADLPVMQADTFEIFINLKTAKQLGLKIPQQLLVRANELIE